MIRKDNRNFAQYCASLGLSVFSCANCPQDPERHKKPLVKWRNVSTTNPKQIDKWWDKWPDALPGIDLAKCKMLVLDGDQHADGNGVIKHNGVAALDALLGEHNIDPASVPGVLTPNDGKHRYCAQPEGSPLGNSEGLLADQGINVRGAGGYVIAPGAQLSDGRRYAQDKSSPNFFVAWRKGSIPVLPASIAKLLRVNGHAQDSIASQTSITIGLATNRHHAYARAALTRLCNELAQMARNSGRNIFLNNAALKMGHMVASGWIERAEVESAITAAALACGLTFSVGCRP